MTETDFAHAIAQAPDPAILAMVALGGMAGLRACEVAALDWADVDLAGGTLVVVSGKGGHARLVPLSAALIAALAALPHRRGPVIRRLDGRLGNCKAHSVSHRANDYLHSLGITATFHQLRHRAGTRAYQATHDLLAVQQLLGHASPTTTAGYAAASGDSVRAAAEALGRVAS